MHPLDHLAKHERPTVGGQRQTHAVHVGGPPDVAVLDAAQDRVIFHLLDEDAARALPAVVAMMADPGLAQDLPAEAALPVLALPGVASVGPSGGDVEGVGGGAQAGDGPARFDVIDDVFHLLVGKIPEAGQYHHQVGGLQGVETGNVIADVGIDGSARGVDGKENRATKSVPFGQDAGELRQAFLGAIFLVAADEDHLLSLAGPVAALIDEPRVAGHGPGRR